MRRSGKGSGGGIGMNKNVHPSVRTGSGSKSTRPAGVAQIGAIQGNHITNKSETDYRGEPLHNPERNFNPVKFGNEVALNVGKGGCGTGRTLSQCGSQGTHGAVDPGNPRPNTQRDAHEQE
jgi:hypothetical protein